MAYGIILKMNDGQYKTPNKGTLMDLDTGTKYTFFRPTPTVSPIPKWNVKERDIVTFTASGNEATSVTLYKKHSNGTVYSYSS